MVELRLTRKSKSAFARIRRRYHVSDSEIIEMLVEHLNTLPRVQQRQLVDATFALGKIHIFPRLARQRATKSGRTVRARTCA